MALTIGQFRSGLADLTALYPELGRELATLKAPFRMLNPIGLDPEGVKSGYFVVAPPELLPADGGIYGVCLGPPHDPRLVRFGFGYVQSARSAVTVR